MGVGRGLALATGFSVFFPPGLAESWFGFFFFLGGGVYGGAAGDPWALNPKP